MNERKLIELIAKGGMVVLGLVLVIGLMCELIEYLRDRIKYNTSS